MTERRQANAAPQRRVVTPEEHAFVALQRTADLLMRELVEVLKPAEISATQYNVLRILRGSPDGLPCGEIADRMVTRDPDVTRLLDRLERRGLISRSRNSKDRRMVLTRITPSGLEILSELDQPVKEIHRKQFRSLGAERVSTLVETLEAVREKRT